MATEGKVKVRIEGDDVHLSKTLDNVEGRFTKMDGVMAGLGGAIGGAVSNGIGQVGAVLAGSIEKASDFNETLSKTGVLFGDELVPTLEKWAGNAATNFGQSKQQALDAASGFAVFGKAAGLSGNDLANFSIKSTTLASDLASFHNTGVDDAVFAIGAAFRGEAEPMRKYGVLLDAASIKAKAVSMGLVQASVDTNVLSKKQEAAEMALRKYNDAVKEHGENSVEAQDAARNLDQAQADLGKTMEGTVGELNSQQKTLAANALIMEQTADAQGDFERTSDGLANSTRSQNAQWENMQITLGEKLLPIKMALVSFIMNQVLPALQTLGAWVQQVGAWFNEHREILVAVGIGIAAVLVPALISWAISAGAAAAATIIAIAPVIAIAAAIAALAAGVIYAYQHWDWFRTTVDVVVGALKIAAQWIMNNVVPAVAWLVTHIDDAARAIWDFGNAVWDVVQRVWGFFSDLANRIGNVISPIKDALIAPFKAAFNAIAELWNNTVGRLSFQVPGWVPGMGGKGFDIPDIPTFAEGGLAFSPMLAVVGDHRSGGAEIISPESKMRAIFRDELGRGGGMSIGNINITNGDYNSLSRELDFAWRVNRGRAATA